MFEKAKVANSNVKKSLNGEFQCSEKRQLRILMYRKSKTKNSTI